jgi:hypothetical protein
VADQTLDGPSEGLSKGYKRNQVSITNLHTEQIKERKNVPQIV